MSFRPYPGFTVFAAAMIGVLCWLGVWQVQRLHWKLALIASTERSVHATPFRLDASRGGMLAADPSGYFHVWLEGRFDNRREAYVFTTDETGAPVYHVLTPFLAEDGRTWLVDRGMVPKERLDPATRREGLIEDETRVTGIWRVPDAPGVFTPAPDAAHRIWYARDLAGISRADGITPSVQNLIEADATPVPGGWPKGGQTVVTFRNEHLSYAVTWFGLALVMAGVWLAYHVSHGRIALK